MSSDGSAESREPPPAPRPSPLRAACGPARTGFTVGGWLGAALGGWTATLNGIPFASLDGVKLALWLSALLAVVAAALAGAGAGLVAAAPGLRGRVPASLALVPVCAVPLLSVLRWTAGGETRPWHVGLALIGGLLVGALGPRAASPAPWLLATALGWIPALALGAALGRPEAPEPRRSAAVRELSAARPPVLLVGFDSLDPRLVDELIRRGRLPHFAALRARGAWGELGTLPEAVSPSIWTTVATGRPPSSHGIRWFTATTPAFLGASFQLWPRHLGLTPLVSGLHASGLLRVSPVNGGMRRVPAFWNLLSAFGRTVTVVNWWCTYPAERVSGTLVSDRLFEIRARTDPKLTWPGSLAGRLADAIVLPREVPSASLQPLTDGPVPATLPRAGDFGTPLGHLVNAVATDASAMAVARRLMARPAQVTAVYLRGVDLVSHGYAGHSSLLAELDGWRPTVGPHAETLARYYERADAQLAELLSLAPPGSNVLVVSDHGIAHLGAGRYHHLDSPPGLLFLAGPDARAGTRVADATVFDVLPTLLHLLGLPPSDEMPGRILAEAIGAPGEGAPVPRVSRHDALARPPAPEGEADPSIRERLRSLGYVQ